MGQPVVHFEIIGTDPRALRDFYGELFAWEYGPGENASEAVSARGEYGFVDRCTTEDGVGIFGGVGGGEGYAGHALFYVGVEEVETALAEAERLGGTRILGPEPAGDGLVVGRFTDPQGNLVGVAGPA